MNPHGHVWAIVLAAGDGTRLASLTTDRQGRHTPKQFCTLRHGRTLLADALARSARLVPAERTLVVVAAAHAPLWREALRDHPAQNIVVQPENRGTAAGLLLPLVEILARDPEALVFVLPSDHYVTNEERIVNAGHVALAELRTSDHVATLLGITPRSADTGYGWIVPGPLRRGASARVTRFIEKPHLEEALSLLEQGALWNSFLMAARGAALAYLAEERVPGLTLALQAARRVGGDAIERLYTLLPTRDFSVDVLQGSEDSLRVLAVPECGWTDLGTPERVVECLGDLRLFEAKRTKGLVSAPLASRGTDHAALVTCDQSQTSWSPGDPDAIWLARAHGAAPDLAEAGHLRRRLWGLHEVPTES